VLGYFNTGKRKCQEFFSFFRRGRRQNRFYLRAKGKKRRAALEKARAL
jgi:hypothetical protein